MQFAPDTFLNPINLSSNIVYYGQPANQYGVYIIKLKNSILVYRNPHLGKILRYWHYLLTMFFVFYLSFKNLSWN